MPDGGTGEPSPAPETSVGIGSAARETLLKADWSKTALFVGLAAVYGFGFIVANSFWEQHTVLSFELLRFRYISAAVLFLCLTFIPQGVGLLAGLWFHKVVLEALGLRSVKNSAGMFLSGLRSLPRGEAVGRFLRVSFADITAIAGGVVLGWSLLFFCSPISIQRLDLQGRTAFLYLIISMAYLYGASVMIVRLAQMRARISIVHQVAISFFLYAGLAVQFGRELYPTIRPAFGGGGVWSVRIVVADSADVSPALRSGLAGSVLLLDRTVDYIQLLYCVPSVSRLQSVELPRGSVATIEIDSIVSVPSFQRSCENRRVRPAGPSRPRRGAVNSTR